MEDDFVVNLSRETLDRDVGERRCFREEDRDRERVCTSISSPSCPESGGNSPRPFCASTSTR